MMMTICGCLLPNSCEYFFVLFTYFKRLIMYCQLILLVMDLRVPGSLGRDTKRGGRVIA